LLQLLLSKISQLISLHRQTRKIKIMTEPTVPHVTQLGAGEHAEKERAVRVDSEVRVIIHNDDVTPYDYVTDTLGEVFMLSGELADHIAWTAHTHGVAVVVVRPRVEAEKLLTIAQAHVKADGFPLSFSMA
jgi:ATP-dependent Clp protease adapter protein ClpS